MKKMMLIALAILLPLAEMLAQMPPSNNENPQQELSRADRLHAEGKTFKALPIYKKHKDILGPDQTIKLAITIVESEDFESTLAFDMLKTAYDAGNTKVTPYLGKLYLEKNPYRDTSTGIQLLQKSISEGNPAGYFYTGWEYVKNNNYHKAREFYLIAANLGNSQAMNALGLLNQNGKGRPRDTLEAIKWYSKSAALGNAFAPMNLGKYYFLEPHINVDSALKWFETAIENGNPIAYETLGLIYSLGINVPKDIEKSREYLNLGIINGDTICEKNLAESYIPFKAKTREDSLTAFKILKKVAAKGYDMIQCQLGRLIINGTFPDENENTGKYWLERSAAQGNMFAMFELGQYYKFNKKDSLESKYYFLKAAKLGETQSMISIFQNFPEEAHQLTNAKTAFDKLAKKNDLDIYEKYTLMLFYEMGIGTEKNLAKTGSLAVDLYGKIPMQAGYIFRLFYELKKFKEALYWLNLTLKKEEDPYIDQVLQCAGLIYATGNKDVPVDNKLSFEYFRKAADMGNLECMISVAHAYLFGNGVSKNVDTAIALFEKAAARNNARAQEMLGGIYMFGQFTEKNGEKSKYWFEKAAAQGEPLALNNLGECYYIGFGTDKNFEKAAFYYQQAVDKNLPMGKLSLGVLYLNGECVKKDKLKAKILFESACKDGLKEGCDELKKL